MSKPALGFSELNLVHPLVKAVNELGYESPLPIQAACIPPLLEGKDVLGLAQTGTGKTGAFALPLLSRIDLSVKAPQVLVLTPTRELAIQVAEAFQAYARYLNGFHVLPIYGGQRYGFQFSQLHRGPQVIVGTPGRIIDHLGRGSLDLSVINTLVLDEADEMLRMGFVDDVETIMAKAPEDRQMALFSATMPPQIKRIASKYLKEPVEVKIESKTTTAENIEQVYMVVPNAAKFEALARILETESYDGILIFARTKLSTTELAERLAARGFDAAALNGDMDQSARERVVNRLKSGKVDIVVATDVAARGLDVDRISLVVNYDVPGDTEAYVHRIGRTGRVGRYGKAILFASPRERRLLGSIERVTRQPIERMEMPSHDAVTKKRIEKFRDSLAETMASEPLEFFQDLSFELMEELDIDVLQLAAGVLCHAQIERPLRPENRRDLNQRWDEPRSGRQEHGPARGKHPRNSTLYRIEVGSDDGVEVRNILGAIVGETGLNRRFVGQIRIHPQFSTVELPDDMPNDVLQHLKKTYVGGKPMKISRTGADGPSKPWAAKRGPENRGGGGPGKGPKGPGAKGKRAKPHTGKPKAGKPKAGKAKAGKPKPGKPKSTKAKAGKPKGDKGKD